MMSGRRPRSLLSQYFRESAVSHIQVERRELENIFALLVLGSFVGFPAPPTTLSIRLLPHLGRELQVMGHRAETIKDIYGEIASLMDL
jgi:hypothetical protein